MFGTYSQLQTDSAKTDAQTRRSHERRKCDQCVSIIDGKMYPVVDWSMGGFQITGDEKNFGLNQDLDITLKFRLNNSILDVPHQARVVRKSKGKIAFEFAPLTRNTRHSFQAVIDDFVARQFADSQIV